MAIEAITFEENGYLRELTMPGDYRQAIAAGRLTPDTVVQCYDASGTFTTARAGDVMILQPIFADPTPAEAEPEVVAEPPTLAPVSPSPAPVPVPPHAPVSASGAPLTAEPVVPVIPAPAPTPTPPLVLSGDPRPAWAPVPMPPPPYPQAPYPPTVLVPPRRKRRGCGCVLAVLVVALLTMVAVGVAWWRSGEGTHGTSASYTALGPPATFYITRSTNVRSDPDTSHSPIGRLARGTRISATQVRSRQGEEYVRIEDGTSAGHFVWAYNVSADPPPALDTGLAGTQRLQRAVDIVSRPEAGAAVLERRAAGRQVRLAGAVADGSWAEVLLDHGVGYIAATDLVGDQPDSAAAPEAMDDE